MGAQAPQRATGNVRLGVHLGGRHVDVSLARRGRVRGRAFSTWRKHEPRLRPRGLGGGRTGASDRAVSTKQSTKPPSPFPPFVRGGLLPRGSSLHFAVLVCLFAVPYGRYHRPGLTLSFQFLSRASAPLRYYTLAQRQRLPHGTGTARHGTWCAVPYRAVVYAGRTHWRAWCVPSWAHAVGPPPCTAACLGSQARDTLERIVVCPLVRTFGDGKAVLQTDLRRASRLLQDKEQEAEGQSHQLPLAPVYTAHGTRRTHTHAHAHAPTLGAGNPRVCLLRCTLPPTMPCWGVSGRSERNQEPHPFGTILRLGEGCAAGCGD